MQKMPKLRARKILTLLDSSGNNLIIAKRIGSRSNALENLSEDVHLDQNLENHNSSSRTSPTNMSFRKSNDVKPRLESRSNNDRNTTRRVRKIADK